jgi:hypothetical protein
VDALDGNAIAGLLEEAFGADLTTATGTCGTCGAAALVAELEVYSWAPGTVVRCRSCGGVLMVMVTVRGRTCVDLRGLGALEAAPTRGG